VEIYEIVVGVDLNAGWDGEFVKKEGENWGLRPKQKRGAPALKKKRIVLTIGGKEPFVSQATVRNACALSS